METKEVKELLAQFDQSSLTEFHLKQDQFELNLSKNTTPSFNQSTAVSSAEVKAVTEAVANDKVDKQTETVAAEPLNNAQPASSLEERKEDGKTIVTPLVGVVYLNPSPEQPPYKKIGDRVEKGDILCIVEAMKVMNEIVSEVAGEITAIYVENEQIVEYDQPLFCVKEG